MGSLRYSVSSPSPARTANPGAPGHSRFPARAFAPAPVRPPGVCAPDGPVPPCAQLSTAAPPCGPYGCRASLRRAPWGRFRFAFCACARPCASGPACPPRRKAGALDSSYYKRARRRPTTPCPPSCARDFPAARPLRFARRPILRLRPALLRPVPRRFPRLRNAAAAAPCPPASRGCPSRAPRPAAKTLPYRYTFPTGPGLRAGEARPRRPALRAD